MSGSTPTPDTPNEIDETKAAEGATSSADTTPSATGTAGSHADGGFSWGRVIKLVLALVVIGGAVGGALYYYQNAEPGIYPVRGVVYLDGEPMNDGIVTTTHPGSRFYAALSVIDKEGRFDLKTNGQPGAYAGEHTVTIMLTDGKFPPTSLIPEKYSDAATTPFRINVDAHTLDEEIRLDLTSDDLTGDKESPAPPPGTTAETTRC